jgi:hypothetical protein
MWNCWECSRCFRQSPKNDVWGYACDAAQQQGFRSIFIVYWLETDPYRPVDWGPHKPGEISVFSHLCDNCLDITAEEYFYLLNGYVKRHDYRYHGGAGGQSVRTQKYEYATHNYNYYCGGCNRNPSNTRDFGSWAKEGMINVEGILYCELCRKKKTVRETLTMSELLEKQWREEMDRRYKTCK